MHHLFEYDPNIYKSIKGLAFIFILEVRLLVLDTVLYLYAHSHILLAVLWLIALKVFAIKLDKLRLNLSKPPCERRLGNINFYLSRYRVEFIKTLLEILDANRMFSKVLVVFLFVNCPLNCLLVILLQLGKIPSQKVTFVGPVALEGFVFIFGIHMAIASVNKRIHAPTKQFIKLNLFNKFCKLKYRIKLDNFIGAFHTKRKYGFQYYSVGIISMFTFVKVSL